MKEIIFSLSLFISGGHVIDTKLKLHKYDNEIYKEIFYLNNKESVGGYCIKHSEFENIKKIRRYTADGKQTMYKVTKSE